MARIISGYRHLPEGPVLQLDELSHGAPGTRRSRLSVRGRAWTLDWSEARHCTGYRDLTNGEAGPCPTQASVAGKFPTCYSCEQRTGFNPSFYNVAPAALSPQQQLYNRRAHVVYLAAFSPETAKVGISTERRVLDRLREQGARRAVIVARCADAYEARAHEEAIHRELYLPEQVRSSRKLALLSERFDAAAVEAYLRALRDRAERTLGLTSFTSDVLGFDTDYLGDNTLELPLTDLSAVSPPSISGVGVGLVGDILIVREGGRQHAMPLKRLIGSVVEVSDRVRPNALRPALQMGFGF
jgi:hypothetical protein